VYRFDPQLLVKLKN